MTGARLARPWNKIGATAVSPFIKAIEQHVALRREVQFLRDRARRLRDRARRLGEMADTHRTSLSDQLRVLAAELDALADLAENKRAGEME